MYSNVYGADGVAKLVELMKDEIIADAGNLGIADLADITPASVSFSEIISPVRDSNEC